MRTALFVLGSVGPARLYCAPMSALRRALSVSNSLVLVWLLLGVLLRAGAAAAADPLSSLLTPAPAVAATPAVPDLLNLDAEWWNYFAPGKDVDVNQLQQRYAVFAAHIGSAAQSLAGEQRVDVDTMRLNIERHFARYLRALQTPAPPASLANPPKDSYSLDAVLELGREGEQRQRSATLEGQELSLLEKSLVRAQERLDAAKLRYRDLPADAPKRLLAGARLVRDRLRIEILNLDLRWRHARQGALAQQLEQHAHELTTAGTHIEISDDAVAQWQTAEKDARKAAETARADLLKLQLNDSIVLASSAVERSQERQHETKTLRRTAEIAVAEARRVTAMLAQHLLLRVAEHNAVEPQADRAVLHAQQAILAEQTVAVAEYAARLAQLRSAIAVESAATDAPEVAAVYAKGRSEIGVVEAGLEELKAQLRGGAQLADLLDQRLREREGRMGQSLRLLQEAVIGSWTEAHTLLARPLFDINDAPVTLLGLMRVGLILTAAWWLSVLLRGGLLRLGQRNSAFSAASLYAVGRVLHYLLMTFGFVIGLSSIGVDLTKFALFASALGVGVGFGLQTLISNFVAGLIILFEQSLNVGDFIELESGATGEVKEINMRATRITTNDNIDILVPNAEFMNSKVMNWTLQDTLRRIHIPFAVAYGTDKELVRTAALAAAGDVDHTLLDHAGREPQVWLARFGESSLDFELVVWLNLRAIKRPGSVISDYCWALETRLREHGIEIPYPQRELHIRRAARGAPTPPGDSDFSPL